MSSYYDRRKCLICRSLQLWRKNNDTSFDVTLNIQVLYLLVMFPIERKCEWNNAHYTDVVKLLKKHGHVNLFENKEDVGWIARSFRNALAHFNYKEANDPCGKKIESVMFYAENKPKQCKKYDEPCYMTENENRKTNNSGHTIEYTFSVSELKSLTESIAQLFLSYNLEDDNSLNCDNCEYFIGVERESDRELE